jgi:hypothetical protein
MGRSSWQSGVVAFILLSAAGCGAHPVPTAASSNYVPWLPLLPSKIYPQAPTPSPAPPVPIPAGTLPCKAAQLEGAMLGASAATGHVNTPVYLRNADSAVCYLEGYPDVTILDGAGHAIVQTMGISKGPTFFGDGPAVQVLMQPGTPPLQSATPPGKPVNPGQAFMNLEWFDCRGTRAASMSLDLPNSGGKLTIAFDFPAPISPVCDSVGMPTAGIARGPLSPAGYPWPPPPKYLTVDIAISAPASAKHGSTLVYFVTLTNTDQIDYLLDPCPNYGELLAVKKPVASYQLNCTTVKHIAPAASVKFEMRLEIPGDLAPGPNALTWALYDGRLAAPYTKTPIDIT